MISLFFRYSQPTSTRLEDGSNSTRWNQWNWESTEIALEVDVRCNVCETLARIPRYWNIFRGFVVVSVALRQLKEQQKQ